MVEQSVFAPGIDRIQPLGRRQQTHATPTLDLVSNLEQTEFAMSALPPKADIAGRQLDVC